MIAVRVSIGQLLQSAQKSNYRTEMEIFLAFLLKKSRLGLIKDRDCEIPVKHMSEIQSAWVKILDGYPVPYLTHEREFFGIPLYVDEAVLVPRPETELLVEHTLRAVDVLYKSGLKPVKILEVGTGSGAIALALKKTDASLEIAATDLSEAALKVAERNIRKCEADIELIHSDLLADVPVAHFNILVANLPYIGEVKNKFIAENVQKHEPNIALFGGYDGLALYERMFKEALEQNRNFEYILGEIGFCQGESIAALANKIFPGVDIQVMQDYNGLDRHFILKFNR